MTWKARWHRRKALRRLKDEDGLVHDGMARDVKVYGFEVTPTSPSSGYVTFPERYYVTQKGREDGRSPFHEHRPTLADAERWCGRMVVEGDQAHCACGREIVMRGYEWVVRDRAEILTEMVADSQAAGLYDVLDGPMPIPDTAE